MHPRRGMKQVLRIRFAMSPNITHQKARHLPLWFQEWAVCKSIGRESVWGFGSFVPGAPTIVCGTRNKLRRKSVALKRQTTERGLQQELRTEPRLNFLRPTIPDSWRRTSRTRFRGWRQMLTGHCSSIWFHQSSCRLLRTRIRPAFQGERKGSLRKSSKRLDSLVIRIRDKRRLKWWGTCRKLERQIPAKQQEAFLFAVV